MRYFSPSTRGFYLSEIHGSSMPSDVVEISDDDYQTLLTRQAAGHIIQFDTLSGKPVAVPIPEPSADELAKVAIATAGKELQARRSVATSRITELMYADELGIATDIEKSALPEWKRYLVLLSRIDTTTAPDIDWPELPKE
ncbi:tail fiber assembly protein [Dickeya oryzae]|uniref:Tail fiber assembly protein n=1 Tax=Dickeya oryzae TaxID=1240404 RepID=A0AB39ISQ8_9GAMM|nr:tail fiber assembly protein [Dickeya oryzae]MBP2856114.1 tail fiber assembly protein [Dickeya oryzae]MCA6990509.1 tail fiber assembly protein [Dickeya oryzae]